MSAQPLVDGWLSAFNEELRKLPAFFRRDLLVMWSYRLAFFADWVGLVSQVIIFDFIGRLVPSGALPDFGGQATSYIEFVAVGIALTSFLQVALTRMARAVREEQLSGTLESVLVSPTAPITWQLGSMVYDLAYVPLRTLIFLLLVSAVFGMDLSLSGLAPTAVMLVVFVPFAWGLGLVSAGSVLTFRRGGGSISLLTFALVVGSNSYFPIAVLPGWVQPIVEMNPLTVTLDAMRAALLGDQGWGALWPAALRVAPFTFISMAGGMSVFRMALERERRKGTIGLY